MNDEKDMKLLRGKTTTELLYLKEMINEILEERDKDENERGKHGETN